MESSLVPNVFPQKLWHLVNDNGIDAIIWNEKGDGIIIKKNLIEKDFLHLNGFKATCFASFVRQLNLYGFRKSQRFNRDNPNIHHYSQPNFKRNQPELIRHLTRCIKKSTKNVKEKPQKDRRERWMEHRNFDDTDDADLHNGEVLSVDFLDIQ